VSIGGVEVKRTSSRALPGAGGPYTSEFLRQKFDEQKAKQKPKRGANKPKANAKPVFGQDLGGMTGVDTSLGITVGGGGEPNGKSR
jgi:hypothetical protein